jgi:hypothetical protein
MKATIGELLVATILFALLIATCNAAADEWARVALKIGGLL